MKPETQLRFAILTRVSTERQAERGHSLQAQVDRLERAVDSLGGTITRKYGGIAEHAGPKYERKEFDRLLEDVPKGIFDAIMVTETSRWSRDNRRNKEAIEVLKSNRVRLFMEGRELDLHSPNDLLHLGIMTEIAENYLEWLHINCSAGRIAGAKKGRPVIGGRIPWGRNFDKESGQWSVDPECQRTAEQMYRMYTLDGLSFRAIGEAMIDPITRLPMDENTVRRRLAGAGSQWAQTICFKGNKETIVCNIPPLLTDSQVAEIRQQAEERILVKQRPMYPLSNLVRCAHCGSVLSHHAVRSGNHTLPQYRHDTRIAHAPECTKFVYRDALERDVLSRLGAVLKDEVSLRAAVRAGISRVDIERDETEKQLAHEVRDLAKLQTASRNLLAAIEASAEVPVEYIERVSTLGKQIKGCEARKARLEAKLKVVELPQDLGIRVRAELDQLIGMNGHIVQHWPMEAKRDLVRFFFGGQTMRGRGQDVGIFVELRRDPEFGKYWVWEARGIFGVLAGALTENIYLQDRHYDEQTQSFSVPPALARTLIEGTNSIHHAFIRARSSSARWPAMPPP